MSTKIYRDEITYFIQGDITRRIKIGKTITAVSERMRNLQTGSPDILKCIGICFGPRRTERYLHRKFYEYRLHGEWFSPEPEILEFVHVNCITDERAFYHAYRKILKGQLTFDEALEIGTSELRSISDRENLEILNNMYLDENGRNLITGESI